MYYEAVFRKLNKKNVRYVVIGGLAVNLHGVPRVTADLDLMVDLEEKNLLNLVKALKELGFKTKVPVNPEELASKEKRSQWVKDKQMKVFSFYNPKRTFEEVDILIENPLSFQNVYSQKKAIKAGQINISLISLNQLIKLKKQVSRKQDLSDIEALKKVKKILKETNGKT